MKLKKIQIQNFRSIENETLLINEINESTTYCLFGVNESGKSSILKAISTFEHETIKYPEDYFDDTKDIIISFIYQPEKDDIQDLKSRLTKEFQFNKEVIDRITINDVKINIVYSPEKSVECTIFEYYDFNEQYIQGYKIIDKMLVKLSKDENPEELNLEEFFDENLDNFFYQRAHSIVFWESTEQYLMLDDIPLSDFAKNPDTSIPLTNSFLLAGIGLNDIQKTISKLSNAASIRNLESKLSDAVTSHINAVWANHPIAILFEINNDKISLLVEDRNIKHKAKTTGQRSDGFKQFISFLLTLSAESSSSVLKNTIMLIDEPETHLHPQGQINLKDELIKITQNKNNNIVFYATHSNYLIDKVNLTRNIKVVKSDNEHTKIEHIENKSSSYSEVNYIIFGIATTDYHNELYGFLEANSPGKLSSLSTNMKWINEKTGKTEDVSLSKYIRHSIHHPENKSNKPFSEKQLQESIEMLRKLRNS